MKRGVEFYSPVLMKHSISWFLEKYFTIIRRETNWVPQLRKANWSSYCWVGRPSVNCMKGKNELRSLPLTGKKFCFHISVFEIRDKIVNIQKEWGFNCNRIYGPTLNFGPKFEVPIPPLERTSLNLVVIILGKIYSLMHI